MQTIFLPLIYFSSLPIRVCNCLQLLKDINKTSIMQQPTSWWLLGGGDASVKNTLEPKVSGGAGAAVALLTARGGALVESHGDSSGGGSVGGDSVGLEKLTHTPGKFDGKASAC